MTPVVVAILGATATGKSALSLAVAERFGKFRRAQNGWNETICR